MEKKEFEKSNALMITIVILILILLILLIVLIPKNVQEPNTDSYIISNEVVELPGTEIIENEKLNARHCLDGICIYKAKIYYVGNEGRMDFKIKNVSGKVKSGYLKMDFGGKSLIAKYESLRPGVTINQTAQYANLDLSGVDDFIVTKLTKEEKAKLNTND